MIGTLRAVALAAALHSHPAVTQVHEHDWLDDVPAIIGLQGCVRQGDYSAWRCPAQHEWVGGDDAPRPKPKHQHRHRSARRVADFGE
jgi:hypothetical protein